MGGTKVDVPIYIIFNDEGCGSAACEKGPQCIQMTKPRQGRTASDCRGVFGAKMGYIVWRPGWLRRDGDADLGYVGGEEESITAW